ncbi:MAG: hypothetical protein QM786_11680 [Breznakibacter sp.]
MDFKAIDIKELIPQREPFVMVGQILEVGDQSITTSLIVSGENVLVHDGFFQESGLVENIAQTAAALSGYVARLNSEKVKLGFIGAIKNLVVHALPEVGTRIETTVEIMDKILNVDIIRGTVRQGKEIMAECEMKIFLEEN